MKKTLITFLGGDRGKDSKQPIYKKVDYLFPSGQKQNARFFGEALLKEQKDRIDQLLVFGTKTSIWETLIENVDTELGLKILETSQGADPSGINNQLLNELTAALKEKYCIDVHLYAGEVGVRRENAFSEMKNYSDILDHIKDKNEILVDFTHGFRSMPILLMTAIQFKSSLGKESLFRNIKLVYGELNREGPSKVHFLEDIWAGVRVAQAARLFFEKFEGNELAKELKPFWKEGAEAINRFSNNVQMNFSRKLKGSIKKLGRALNAKPEKQPPAWFESVHFQIRLLYDKLKQKDRIEFILLSLSRLLSENGLYGQAFLALDESVLSFAIFYNKKEDNCNWKEAKRCYHGMKDNLKKDELRKNMERLHNIRNIIAHGGRMDRDKNSDNVDSLKNEFERLYVSIKKFIDNPKPYLKSN